LHLNSAGNQIWPIGTFFEELMMFWSIFSDPAEITCAIVELLITALLEHQFDKIDHVGLVVGCPNVHVVYLVVGQFDHPVAVRNTVKKSLIDCRVTHSVILD